MKTFWKSLSAILMIGLLLLALTGCAETAEEAVSNTAGTTAPNVPETETPAERETPAPTEPEETSAELCHAEIEVENYGTIYLELDPVTAPITVDNFISLAESGFYDGLTFHRIMDGFMIQGGDPEHNGFGGSGTNIKGEFSANGVENNISHVKGVISMARATPPDSASSQFFIMVADGPFLDGQYAAFGWVTDGIEIVEQIAKDARPIDNNGTIPYEEQPVITRITITD